MVFFNKHLGYFCFFFIFKSFFGISIDIPKTIR